MGGKVSKHRPDPMRHFQCRFFRKRQGHKSLQRVFRRGGVHQKFREPTDQREGLPAPGTAAKDQVFIRSRHGLGLCLGQFGQMAHDAPPPMPLTADRAEA